MVCANSSFNGAAPLNEIVLRSGNTKAAPARRLTAGLGHLRQVSMSRPPVETVRTSILRLGTASLRLNSEPTWPRIGADQSGHRRSGWFRPFPRSPPDRSCFATGYRNAVAIVVARPDHFPTRPRIGADRAAADPGWFRSFPRSQPGRLVFCHRMSEWPSSLKSPVPTTFQLGPGLAPTVRRRRSGLVPSISQIAAWPSVFCNRMSELPSPLKSPVPTTFQLGPGLAPTGPPPTIGGPVHFPDRDLAVRVLPQDVGIAVVVEVARSDRFPIRPRIGGPTDAAADLVGSVHFPDRRPGRSCSATGCRIRRRR